MQELKYEIYNLGGNDTAIISEKLSDEKCIEVAERIMDRNPNVEQVAMIIDVYKNNCIFKMVGGEFCGNACRAVAEYMRKNYGFIKCNITLNDIKMKGTSDGNSSEITVAKNDLVKKVENNGLYTVFMRGITCVVRRKSLSENVKLTAENIKQEFEKTHKINDAFGVIFLENDKIDPFVWVAKAHTFFNETACLSGSIAAALFLKQGKIHTRKIIQPTNENYNISIGKVNITARGKVKFAKDDLLVF